MLETSLRDEVKEWIEQDPDPETSQALTELLGQASAGDECAGKSLKTLFGEHLRFGTAGLRGELGPGPSRMNRVVVSHAARGLGQFLLCRRTNTTPHVVVGFDARQKSDVFAEDTAEILSGLGISVSLFSHTTPTPVLAYAVRHLGADAGVMVTASHNPRTDNGYKVYVGGEDNGSQITSPTDLNIHSEIMASHNSYKAKRLLKTRDFITTIGSEIEEDYIAATLRSLTSFPRGDLEALRVCYTPLHGVGGNITGRLFSQLGVRHLTIVASQADPDPLFPTVSFPNPEEEGALDEAYATATAHSCDVIIAHDPDADRLAVAVPNESEATGWKMLTGNQLGAILLAAVAENRAGQGLGGTLASSLVSTPIIRSIAQETGLNFWECPTGFKWISRAPGIVAGFEEALGYLVTPDVVSDKDGISAAALALFIAGVAKHNGEALTDVLNSVMATYGAFSSDQVTLRLSSAAEAAAVMAALRERIQDATSILGTSAFVDYLNDDHSFPPSDMIRLSSPTGERVIFRPSGTEPKLKVYVDAIGSNVAEATQTVAQLAKKVCQLVDMLGFGAVTSS